MNAAVSLSDAVPDEEHRGEGYPELVRRLSRQSVLKHYDAYESIDWDAPEHRIDPGDPRWELDAASSTLAATAWYRGLPQPTRARLGLHTVCSHMRIGLEFENVLSRGLLQFAVTLPDGAPEFRYAYHELIEESQHTLIFREFLNRAGLPTAGVGGFGPLAHLGASRVARLGRQFPELFFIFVLGGEDPIDHVQRGVIRSGRDVHPLVRRVMQIHITEEARHLCFAREYLREHVPALSTRRRQVLMVAAPSILAGMAQMMMRPPLDVVRPYGIPDAVIAEAYTRNPRFHARTHEALSKVRELCAELDILRPWLWRRLGLMP
jgi:hypothetical protein